MKESLVDKIYEDIKRQILSLQYGVNEMITEMAVAEKYGVSKTPAREALNRLCFEGYIVRYPSSGYFIKALTMKDFVDISQVRILLETGAVKIIIEKASDEEIMQLYEIISRPTDSFIQYHDVNTAFHTKLGEITKNTYLQNTIVQMVNADARPSMFRRFTEDVKPNNRWHKEMVDCIMKRDVDGALAALYQDINPQHAENMLQQSEEAGLQRI